MRSALVLLLVATPVIVSSNPTGAQDTEESAAPADEPASETAADEEVAPDADQPPESEIDTADDPAEPVEETGAEPALDPVLDEATPEPDIEVPPAPNPTLAFDPTAAPDCVPLSGEPVRAGGDLQLTCTYALALNGGFVDPASIMLDWSVSAAVSGDWSVQLLDPTGDPSAWTDPGLTDAALGFQTAYSFDSSIGTLESLQDVATIQFGLLLHRPVCTTDPVSLEVDVTGSASIPASDQAVVTSNTAQPLIATFEPVLAEYDTSLPTVSIVDIAVDPVAFSLTDTQTHGTLTIRVENPVLQCRAANVLISVQASAGSDIEDAAVVSAVGALDESTIAGALADASGEGSSLSGSVVVSTLQSRAEAGSYLQTIDFELTVPGAIAVGAYWLAASATIEAVE